MPFIKVGFPLINSLYSSLILPVTLSICIQSSVLKGSVKAVDLIDLEAVELIRCFIY